MALTLLMSESAACLLVILIVHAGSATIPVASPDEAEEFFKRCPPARCGGLVIRFPLRLSSARPSCGQSGYGFDLSCSANRTILTLPSFGHYAVSAIDYKESTITAAPFGPPPPCPFRNLTSFGVTGDNFFGVTIVNCSVKFSPGEDDGVAGPISCLSDADHFGYLAWIDESMSVLPTDCMSVSAGGQIPYLLLDNTAYFVHAVEALAQRRVIELWWSTGNFFCEECELSGKICGFSFATNQPFCYDPVHHRSRTLLITCTSIGGLVVLMLVAFILVYSSRETAHDAETRVRVERFLATYSTTNPSRYSFTGIKKITKNFKHKLGQGGFGTVYKGVLPNGIPVAVKMLEKSRGKGEEFTNEVGTIGRIHHVNIVRLLGFCSEGTRHALVYEFMPNESLEKYISSTGAKVTSRVLSTEKLQDIALGIAQGIEYLHKGCDQVILHFDIKPHNILLDHDLNPKISDFGLAKLCSKDISIVTMTAARGTMGYIAPEIYSRNFGTVSSKSDVYSFGMLLMDMVGGKEIAEPSTENQTSVYFPEVVYDRLAKGKDLRLRMGAEEHQEETAQKLLIVALWCIQWSPVDRPSMSEVVKMLMGSLQGLEMPPKPFASTDDHDSNTSPIYE